MAPKHPKDFSIDEVCLWLAAIGLGSKMDAFKENAIDGSMLVTLGDPDLMNDLGLSSLQARKFRQSLDFSIGLVASGGGGGPDPRVPALEQENARLKAEVADLRAMVNALQGPARAPAPAPRPPPQQYQQPPPQQYQQPPPQQYHQQRPGHPVVAGAAGGAAKGAMLGAIGGAIAGDPAMGAKMGAAMGAAGGGMGGLAQRRAMRRQQW